MASSNFQVNVPSGFSNPDVRKLSETERSAAGMLGFSEDEFRQRKLEFLLTEEKRKDRGRSLGTQVQAVLRELGDSYHLVSVTWNDNSLSWTLEIATPQGMHNVVLPWTLVDDVLDSRTRSQAQRLRNMVLFGLGRRDLIFEKHE